MHSGGSRFLQLGEGAIYMLDQLSCAVGALHFGEIWNQLGEGGPNCPNVSPAPGPLSGNRSTRTQATRPGQLAPSTQDNSHPTMSQLAPDSMLRTYCFRKTMLIIWYIHINHMVHATLCSLKHGLFCFIPDYKIQSYTVCSTV